MVNLPKENEEQAREPSDRFYRSTWRSRHGRRRDSLLPHTEPTSLHELEKLAMRTVKLMEKYSPKSDQNFHKAMDLLRLQYNLNFIILCEKCKGTHVNDEILAPER